MSQIFRHSTNTFARITIFGAVFILAFLAWVGVSLSRSSYATRADQAREQPVPFSHAHHVGGMGLDCRYCHTSVEKSSFAGIPPTKTCMNCHSQIWLNSPTLEPVRASFRTNESIPWTRVYDLPDFVYFNHSIHVNKGVGCETCHGRVDKMALTWQSSSLQMEWCLDCHRAPEKALRPREYITKMGYAPEGDQEEIGRRLMKEYNVRDVRTLTSCNTCHR
ncbi:MAG TPA: cytochrome c3 family protein [Candidatus Solibacter sp.]|nr:cytochrome c3 family protein [Candidatus Solibacter sp.]